jgi:class 3 adenylate cyclase
MVGEAVNIAHRLVDLAQDAQIVIMPDMLESIQGIMDTQQFTIRHLPPVNIKGIDEPMSIIALELTDH